MQVLLFGSTGWIGGQLSDLLKSQGHEIIPAKSRLDEYGSLEREIEDYEGEITHVLNCAGKTGVPNIDELETKKIETLRVNTFGTAILADLCFRKGIHYTYLGTGCLFEYDDAHPIPSTDWSGVEPPGFLETEPPNFEGSFYSYSKILTEKLVKEFPTSLILRLRMPISSDFHPRSFITKILTYEKVVNVPNSMSILDDLLPLVPDLMEKKVTGVFNFTNPGVISHHEILDWYKIWVDPEFTYVSMTLEEQAKILKAGRSNTALDVSKLRALYPDLPSIRTSLVHVLKRMKDFPSGTFDRISKGKTESSIS